MELIVSVIVVIITSIIGPISIDYFKSRLEAKKNKKNDPLKESLEINSLVIDKLESIKDSYNADRVWLIQFHNGGYFYPTGKSIQKFTMVYEQLKEGFPSCQYQFQGLPVSLCSRTINKLYDGNNINSNTHNDTNSKYGITNILSDGSVTDSYMFPIITIKDTFIGIVGIDFKNSRNLSEEHLKQIDIDIATISGVLMNYLKTT